MNYMFGTVSLGRPPKEDPRGTKSRLRGLLGKFSPGKQNVTARQGHALHWHEPGGRGTVVSRLMQMPLSLSHSISLPDLCSCLPAAGDFSLSSG